MEDYSLFSRDTEVVTAELNKTKWLPFIGKEKVFRLITSLTNRWAELYRVKRIEDNKNVLSRLQELDRNYQEREEFRMQLLVKTLEEYKKSFIKKSECAFAWRYVKRLPHREKTERYAPVVAGRDTSSSLKRVSAL